MAPGRGRSHAPGPVALAAAAAAALRAAGAAPALRIAAGEPLPVAPSPAEAPAAPAPAPEDDEPLIIQDVQYFPVPAVAHLPPNSTMVLRLAGLWGGAAAAAAVGGEEPKLCLVVGEDPEACRRLDAPCSSTPLWQESDLDRFLLFQIPRPAFTAGLHLLEEEAHNHSVCLSATPRHNTTAPAAPGSVDSLVLGRLAYYPLPEVHFLPESQHISVRTFLNPGWKKELMLGCANCSASNVLAVVPLSEATDCIGPAGTAASTTVQSPGQAKKGATTPPWLVAKPCGLAAPRGPCGGYLDPSFDLGVWAGGDAEAETRESMFVLATSRRLPADQRRKLFKRRSAICFYGDNMTAQGLLAGYVEFHIDGYDVQAFVGFVCFFGIALPLLCMVTILLHVSKYQQFKQNLQELRLHLQRSQLARELGRPVDPPPDRGGIRSLGVWASQGTWVGLS